MAALVAAKEDLVVASRAVKQIGDVADGLEPDDGKADDVDDFIPFICRIEMAIRALGECIDNAGDGAEGADRKQPP